MITNILELLDQTGYQAFSILLGFTWQMTVLIAAAIVLTFVLRNHRASIRRVIWISAILLIPFLPLLSTLVSNVGIPQTPVVTVQSYNMAAPASITETIEETMVDLHEKEASGAVSTNIVTGQKTQPFSMLDYPWALGFMAYILGSMGFLALAVLGHIRIARWIYSAVPTTDVKLKLHVEEAKSLMGISRKCTVLESDCVSSPIVVGVFLPQIIFPRQLITALSTDEIRSILHHEMAHIKRNDPAILSCVSLFSVFFYFHPLFWYAYRRISSLSEQAADDMVLDLENQPLGYAKLLSRLAEDNSPGKLSTNFVTGFCLSQHVFIKRIEAILSRQRSKMRKLTGAALSAILISMMAAIMFVVIFPSHQELAIAQTAPASESGQDASKQEERVLVFPDNSYMGYLRIKNGNQFSHGAATGKVIVSASAIVTLEIEDPLNPKEEDLQLLLTSLKSLKHDDLHTIRIETKLFSEEDLQYIEGLTSLRSLSVNQRGRHPLSINGSGLKYLKGMKSLTKFEWKNFKINDEALIYLKPLKSLEILSFYGTPVGDEGIKHIASLENLSDINLLNTNVTDIGLSYLGKLKKLKRLSLPATTTARGLSYLSGMEQLEYLQLNTRLQDAGLSHLSNLPKLKTLILTDNTLVSDKGLENLSEFTSLESIDINSDNITGECLKHLQSLPALKRVDLDLSMMNDEGMKYLRGLPINRLHLSNSDITDQGLASVNEIYSLVGIVLDNTAITDDGLKYLSGLLDIQYISLDNTKITDKGLVYLTDLYRLGELGVSGTEVSDKGLEYFKDFQTIRSLDLGNTKITDEGLAHITEFPRLHQLTLSQTKISDKSFVHLKKMKSLNYLSVEDTEMSYRRVERLRPYLPYCRIYSNAKKNPPTKKSSAQPDAIAPEIEIGEFMQASHTAMASWEALQGKVVVFVFWATWNSASVEAIPHINDLAEKMADKPVQFIMVALENESYKKVEIIKDFLEKNKVIPWVALDSDRIMYDQYVEMSGVSGLPLMVVVDKERKVISVSSPDKVSEETINKLLEK